MDQAFACVLSAVVGAFVSAVPVWITLKRTNAELKKQHGETLLLLKKGEQSLALEGKINTEAEWKRVIDEKDKELVRLRSKDDEQEGKLTDLLNRHIECKQNEARQDERSKNLSERCDRQDGDIKALTNKILHLERLLRKQTDVDQQSSGGTVEPGNAQ